MNQKPEKHFERRKFTTVSIPTQLFKKVEERITGTGFTSVSSYVTYVLREIVAEEDEEAESPFTSQDEERVKARLKALGYID
jgi:Arc/MetJ-type ribon-helix-helix transcriptional regulator